MGILFDVITIGYIFNENIHFPESTSGPFLGGTVSYSSVTLGRLGCVVGIVSNIGEDMPEALLSPIYGSNVNTDGLHIRTDSPTTTNVLVYDKEGNKQLLYLKKASKLSFDDIPIHYFDCRVFYFCPVDFEVSHEVVARVKVMGALTAADMGGFGGAHCSAETRGWFLKDRCAILTAYARNLDIVKVSMEDCVYLFNERGFTEHEALQRLLDLGVKIAIMTMGERGAVIASGNMFVSIPAIPVKAVDTTGAGDTFMAAFLSEYIRTSDIKASGLFASAASSILVERSGGVNIGRIPDRAQVLKRMGS